MTPEESMKNFLEDYIEFRLYITQTYGSAQIDNIKQIRDLIEHFTIISIGIIGFTIPVFGKTNLVKDSRFLIGGLLILLIVILYGLYSLTNILSKENKNIKEQQNKYLKLLNEVIEMGKNYLENMTQENFDQFWNKHLEFGKLLKFKEEEKLDYSVDIILWSFFMSLVLIVISLI
ncbi:MAG: hypothetical protein V1833_03540 [Elusimicrobiota bacterium]